MQHISKINVSIFRNLLFEEPILAFLHTLANCQLNRLFYNLTKLIIAVEGIQDVMRQNNGSVGRK